MKIAYHVHSLFRGPGTIISDSGRARVDDGRFYTSRGMPIGAIGLNDSRITSCHNLSIAPVHGVPTPASKTLLADILRNTKSYTAYITDLTGTTGDAGLLLASRNFAGQLRSTAYSSRNAAQQIRTGGPFQRVSDSPADRRRDMAENAARIVKNSNSYKGRLVSVEIEYYPSSRALDIISDSSGRNGLLSICSDGSLSSGGREIRRMSWVDNTGRITGLFGLKKYLEGGTVDKCCGLHVHVDVRHLPVDPDDSSKYRDVGATYDLLASVEMIPLWKHLLPTTRWNNGYAKFINNRERSPHYRQGDTGGEDRGGRYSALNYLAYDEHGTIEFRMAPGSTNVLKIESWALVCRHMTDYLSIKSNPPITTWKQFLNALPAEIARWCVARRRYLHGAAKPADERIASAMGGETLRGDGSSITI